ncbi:Glutathione S-transferase omega-1 [Acropora cervicornis]|uniref:Glutathione S-transferase omega n=1 Tax=Acropora cervicornis TaxID=6130 RepID=A0AAD9VE24_ACRCE|nr:Glutathione S-transferase omega-1 [Acropora cervicornis]
MTHYSKGSEKPPMKGDVLRLYSMRFCPFAQRTQLVLSAKGIPHECININLKTSQNGKVPVIEHPNGKVIYESAICCDYLEELFPEKEPKLYPKDDPFKKYKQRLLVETVGSALITAFYKSAMGQEGGEEAVKKHLVEFENYLKQNHTCIGGDEPGMGDYLMWPWFERLDVKKPETLCSYPATQAWCTAMKELPAVKDCTHQKENYEAFWERYRAGDADAQLLGIDKEKPQRFAI